MLYRPFSSSCSSSIVLGLTCLLLLSSAGGTLAEGIVRIQSAISKDVTVKIEGVNYTLALVPGNTLDLTVEEVDSVTITKPTLCYISTLTKTDYLPLQEQLSFVFVAVCVSFTLVLLSCRFGL